MFIFVFCFSVLIALVVTGHGKSAQVENSQYVINADWLEHPDKFSLIARWGIK